MRRHTRSEVLWELAGWVFMLAVLALVAWDWWLVLH